MGRLKDMWEAESNGGVPKSVPMLNRLFVGSPGDANTKLMLILILILINLSLSIES